MVIGELFRAFGYLGLLPKKKGELALDTLGYPEGVGGELQHSEGFSLLSLGRAAYKGAWWQHTISVSVGKGLSLCGYH